MTAMMGTDGFFFKPPDAMFNATRRTAEPAMSDINTLYDEDFLAWSQQQAEALRAAARTGSNRLLDWENLAEEIESLGVSQKTALRSQMRRIVRHLLKLEFSPAVAPRRGWFESVNDARSELDDLLETSPSLKGEVTAAAPLAHRQGAKAAIVDLEGYGKLDPGALARIRATTYTEDQILGDWFPPEPTASPRAE
jgi:hypothetical protein